MSVKLSSVKPFARAAAALALMAAVLPAHAGDVTAKCDPAPVQCGPKPPCNPAVPEPASVALLSVGVFALLPLGMRALKSRRQAA
jgi:hypothetical protein